MPAASPPQIKQSALLVSSQWSSPKPQLLTMSCISVSQGKEGGTEVAGEVVVVGVGGRKTSGNFSSSISQ